MLLRSVGEVVARGTRSSVRAYGSDAVIKVPDRGTPDAWIVAEARYAEAVRVAGAPAPRLLGLERFEGRTASVWEWVRGPSMWQEVVEAPDRAAGHGRVMAELQLGLLELVPPVLLPAQHDRLVSKIRRSAVMFEPHLAGALDRLPAGSGALRVCHGDLHPGNIIMSADGPVVIDWFDASRGEPAADIARSILLLGGAHGGALPRHLPGATRELLGELSTAYGRRVKAALGISDDELRRWSDIEAVARLAEGVSDSGLPEVWGRAMPLRSAHWMLEG